MEKWSHIAGNAVAAGRGGPEPAMMLGRCCRPRAIAPSEAPAELRLLVTAAAARAMAREARPPAARAQLQQQGQRHTGGQACRSRLLATVVVDRKDPARRAV